MAEPTQLQRTQARRLTSVELDDEHRASCPLCKLSQGEREQIEALYLRWTPAAELAELAPKGKRITPATVTRHAAWFGLDAARLAQIPTAYARLIEDGLAPSADTGRASDPGQVFKALTGLRGWLAATQPGTPPAGIAPADPSGLTWEQKIERTD